MTYIFVIIGIVLCIVLSAFFSASEMAISSCNTVRLENEEKGGNKASGRALRLYEHYDDTLSTILLGNNLVNIAASSLTTVLTILIAEADQMNEDTLNFLGTLIVTVLIIIFGETVPKIISKKTANRSAANVSGLITMLYYIFWPVNFLIVGITGLLTKKIRTEEETDDDEAQEELQSIIETAEDEGILDSDQSELMSAAIDFKDTSADEVMTARVDMQAIDINDSPEKILAAVLESSHSRMPVYEDSIDHIIGVVHLNHLLKALSKGETMPIRDVMMEPCYIYKTTKLPQALNIMKEARQHLAIVTDEYSGTLGVISMEDVLEQIVGDIWDETDVIEEEVVENEGGELIVDGDMAIGDFLELVGIDEDEFEYESGTAGGFTIEYFGDFPEEGDSFRYENFELKVLKMDGRRVEKLLVLVDDTAKEEED